MRTLILAMIKGYQWLISPFFGGHCRFYPTCSVYVHEAIATYGLAKGAMLGIKRISKCHPWHTGGFDPLPKNDK